MRNNVHELQAHPRCIPPSASGPTPPNLRMFLTGPADEGHILTMRSTFAIQTENMSRESAHAFRHHAAGMVRALGLQLCEIEVMSAYSMEIGE